MNPSRHRQLSENLSRTRSAVADACHDVGRDVDEVTLIAVTKRFPATDVIALAELGIRDIGENRDQEAAPKAREVAESGVDVDWHFIGQLQRNKCRSVATYATMVHSVDRVGLVSALDKARAAVEKPLPVLIQVSIDGDIARGGVAEDDLEMLAETIAASDWLQLRGVMAVAPMKWEPRSAFERLVVHSETVRRIEATAIDISAGMSSDYRDAIACGSTFIRLGSNLLGARDLVG